MLPLLTRLLRALVFGALASVLVLGTIDLALRLGPMVWLVFALLTLAAFFHAQEHAALDRISRGQLPTLKTLSRWLSATPEPAPVPQMLQSHDELFTLRTKCQDGPGLTPRDEVRIRMKARSADLSRVVSAVKEMKARGWWEYYAPRLWSDFRPPSGEIMLYLLREGVHVARFDSQFEPIIFQALDSSPARGLHLPLLDALLGLGAALSDRDLEDRNLIEKRIEMLARAPFAHPNLPGQMDDATELRCLWERTPDIRPEYMAKLRAHVGAVGGAPRQHLIALVDEIEASQQHGVLQAQTAEPVLMATARRL